MALHYHCSVPTRGAKPQKWSEVSGFPGSDQCFGKTPLVLSFQTLSYNRHNLTTDTSERQAKEILIRRRHSLRESIRKDSSLNREHRVRGCLPLGSGRLPRAEPAASLEGLLTEWPWGVRDDSQESWDRVHPQVFPDVSPTPIMFQTPSRPLE